MDKAEREMHLLAGMAYGSRSTCTVKRDYGDEVVATATARRVSTELGRELEAYPCFWCAGWHIGRKMTEEERAEFSARLLSE